jgi:putative redox protein
MTDRRTARVRWVGHGLVFEGSTGDTPPIMIDGSSKEGPSPTETLLMAVAACMAIDIKVILEKGRVTFSEIFVEMDGDRAPEPPRRFLTLRMKVRVVGPEEEDLGKVERAAELSRDKYCSVFHTLRKDIEVGLTTELG